MLDLKLELLTGKLNDLLDLLLGVEGCHESAFLGDFEEVDVEMLFLDWAIADAELHEEVLEQDLLRVVQVGDSHCEDPKADGDVQELSFGETVV